MGGDSARSWLAMAWGIWLGLALVKFGNPVILDELVPTPGNIWEFLFQGWPVEWGYIGLTAIFIGLAVWRISKGTKPAGFLWAAPSPWMIWQCISATCTVKWALTKMTLIHFASCWICFAAGYWFCGSESSDARIVKARREIGFASFRTSPGPHPGQPTIPISFGFWCGLAAGLLWMLWAGLEQHYGGLDAVRRYVYSQPGWEQFPPEYLKRIASNRIFATLVSPNAVAGVILLLMPPLAWALWIGTARWQRTIRMVLLGFLSYAAVACFYWTGSKGGWLIALAVAGAALLQMGFSRRIKWILVSSVLALGLIGFAVKFAPYFRRGAPSAGARFEYWKGAWKTFLAHPVVGTGPGTFGVPFAQIKPPEAEMTRLVHNDYLEQASDSGALGWVGYVLFVPGLLTILYRARRRWETGTRLVWLGLLGWALQGLIDFGLYIPALSWPFFTLLGWGAGWVEPGQNPIDKPGLDR